MDTNDVVPEWATKPLEREYYLTEWGMPVVDERGVLERIVLEGFQSGISWSVVLAKRPAFREAFADFDPDAVAAFDDDDVARILGDERIVRNRLKIEAAIANARATVALRSAEDLPEEPQAAEAGLARLVWSFRPDPEVEAARDEEYRTTSPESVALAKELKRRGFTFVGPTTMYALMQAIGLVNDHPQGSRRREECAAAVASLVGR